PATLCRAISTVLNVESLDVTPSGPSLLNKSASSFVQRVEMLATPTVVSKPKPIVVGHPIHTLAELQQQIHDDLRRQHPEWIEPNGESPMCDFYEARLSQLLKTYTRSGPDEITPPRGNLKVGRIVDAPVAA